MPAVHTPCPECSSRLSFVQMTNQDADGRIVRRRVCRACGHKWYTLQWAEEVISPYQLRWDDKKPYLRV